MTTNEIKKNITKIGSAVAFDAKGETIAVKYMSTRKAWVVTVTIMGGLYSSMNNGNARSFADKDQAAAFVAEIADDSKTAELKWW